jgi:nitrite reductase (cytochrome c-552)
MLASSVMERRGEAVQSRVDFMKPIAAFEADNSKWGISFPREYNSWESTKKMEEKTKYGGSAARDNLAEHPNLPVMWAGFAFAKQYNAPRGHYYALEDVKNTKRLSPKTPATCWTCKSPDVPRLMARDGVDKFYAEKFTHYADDVKNPIGCADCHNNETMALQISRPALKEAYLAAKGKDISKATHQEMRSLVCAQCHVTYYFTDKKTNKLKFPWDDGLNADDMDKYYKRVGFSDFTHAISGAKMIKMRHADYEVYSQGVHAFRGVSCADCHMPYKTEGGVKYTDHQIRSPLQNVANSCQVCHRWSESDIKKRVESIQDKNYEMLKTAEDAITALHLEIGDAMRLGASDAELEDVRDSVRRAQMYWDYVAATNGMGFHAPQESARVLDKATKIAMEGRLDVNRIRARKGAIEPMTMPDISTKEKAQAYIKPFVDAQAERDKAKEAAQKLASR